jgi:hypothetical protein
METNSEFPILRATSALKDYLVKYINEQQITFRDFTVSNDHPNNIQDQEHPNLNLYPFLINLAPDSKNVPDSNVVGPFKTYPLRIHFLLSATGDHTKLFPHILIDNAIKTVIERPILEIDEYNSILRISLVPMNTEESAKIWAALRCSHRMNIVLLVDIASKDSTDTSS